MRRLPIPLNHYAGLALGSFNARCPSHNVLLLAAGLTVVDAQSRGGFLAQLTLGAGYTAIDSGPRDVGSNGPALNAGVHLGYFCDGPIAIALHGFVDGEIITTNGGASDRPAPGSLGYLFGAGPELLLTASDLRFGLKPALVGIIHGSSGVATESCRRFRRISRRRLQRHGRRLVNLPLTRLRLPEGRRACYRREEMKTRTWWLGCCLGSLAVSGCGQDQPQISPLLSLQDLPGSHLTLQADRGETGSGDIGLRVTVTITYDTSGDFCGTLRSPVATLGGVGLALQSAGAKGLDPDRDFVCDFPTFQAQFGPNAPQGPLEVTDGVTTARLEYDVLDPGTATLVAPADGVLHPGQSARWQLNLPPGHALSDYRVYSGLTVEDWAQGSATPAGGEVVAAIPASVPANYSGSGGLLVLSWMLNARVTACASAFICEVRSSALTGFDLTIRP
jgi:hypothetical protein